MPVRHSPNDRNTIPFRNSLIRLRFIGDQLENRSLPIYELGSTLISMQRIINKAYLFEREDLYRSAKLSREVRERVRRREGRIKNGRPE